MELITVNKIRSSLIFYLDNASALRWYLIMINSFGDSETELIYKGLRSKKLPPTIHNVARRKLRMIAAAKEVKDLRVPPGNNLEQLVGNLAGLWSIRINDQWRIVFTFENGGADNVRITDYH